MTIAPHWTEPGTSDAVLVSGPDASTYLHSQVSQDLRDLEVGGRRWTFVLEPTGKIDAVALVTRVGEESFRFDVDAGFGEHLLARLQRFKIRVNAELSLEPAEAAPSEAAQRARVEAGWPAMGTEIEPGRTIPAETGLVPIAVNRTKGCYPGQELVERMDSRGADAPRSLRRLDVGPDASVGDPVLDADGTEVGTLTSVAAPVALGYVRRGADVGTRVLFTPPDA